MRKHAPNNAFGSLPKCGSLEISIDNNNDNFNAYYPVQDCSLTIHYVHYYPEGIVISMPLPSASRDHVGPYIPYPGTHLYSWVD